MEGPSSVPWWRPQMGHRDAHKLSMAPPSGIKSAASTGQLLRVSAGDVSEADSRKLLEIVAPTPSSPGSHQDSSIGPFQAVEEPPALVVACGLWKGTLKT